MKGIMSVNPFNVLHYEELDNVAKIVGVNINNDIDSMHSVCSSPGADSLSDKDQHEELAKDWIDVIRKFRGKHPKKFYPLYVVSGIARVFMLLVESFLLMKIWFL
jgi:hypothetical protein